MKFSIPVDHVNFTKVTLLKIFFPLLIVLMVVVAKFKHEPAKTSKYNNNGASTKPTHLRNSEHENQVSDASRRLLVLSKQIRKSSPAEKDGVYKILQQSVFGTQPNLKELYDIVAEYENRTGQIIKPSWIGPYAERQPQEFGDLAKAGLINDPTLFEGIKYLVNDHPDIAFECIKNHANPQPFLNTILPHYLDFDSKRASELVLSLINDSRYDYHTNAKIISAWLSKKGLGKESELWYKAEK